MCCLSAAATIVSLIIMKAPDGVRAKSPNRSFVGRMGKRGNQDEMETSGVLTLGELDQLMQNKGDDINSSTIFGSGFASGSQHQQNQQYVEKESNPNYNQLQRGLRRINLDLSGRVMCHLISPKDDKHIDATSGESIPLFFLPPKHQTPTAHNMRRFIPHIYLGANYDLDEVWFGATRWIAKCSWGPFSVKKNSNSETENASSSESLANKVLQFSGNAQRKIFPSSSFSSASAPWIIGVEGEQSVFDHCDTTARLRLIQSPSSISSKLNSGKTRTQISVEYDSAKYYDDAPKSKRSIQYAPTIAMDVKTPFLHPRLEIHSKKTWIVTDGGDDDGNYYGGDYYGSRSSVDRQLDRIKERYRESIPKSNATPITATEPAGKAHNFAKRLSRWLENESWMQKVTTDLMGNLVSVSEVDIGAITNGNSVNKKPPLPDIISPIRDAGIRLRISKKIDWTRMGIFPWSKIVGGGQSNDNINVVSDELQSTRVRLELCGLFGSEEKCASVGVDADPFDLRGTFKVIIGQDNVAVLGK